MTRPFYSPSASTLRLCVGTAAVALIATACTQHQATPVRTAEIETAAAVEAPAGSAPQFVTSLSEGCYNIHSVDSFLEKGKRPSIPFVDSYFGNSSSNKKTAFYLRPTGANTYLIYDDSRAYMSAGRTGDGIRFVLANRRASPTDLYNWAEWEIKRDKGVIFQLRSTSSKRYLAVFEGWVTAIGNRDRWWQFRFAKATGCKQPPTTDLKADFEVPVLRRNQPIRGIADLHGHNFANEAFGGKFFQGRAFHPWGIDAALSRCDLDAGQAHGPGGAIDLVGNALDSTLGHKVGGSHEFDGWPLWYKSTHQMMYYEWLNRARLGGLRLQVMLAVNNGVLCNTRRVGLNRYKCDDMVAVDKQIAAARAMEKFVDAQNDGDGWFKIVTSSAQARRVMEKGKLAVVLGMEVDFPFECKPNRCDPIMVREELGRYYDKGVRYVFPVHVFDNAFGGAALYNPWFSGGNIVTTGKSFRVLSSSDCRERGYEYDSNTTNAGLTALTVVLTGFAHLGFPEPPWIPTTRPHCNSRGLTQLGKVLIDELMKRKMIVDIDHMSDETTDGALLRFGRNYPVVAGHTGFIDTSLGQAKAESQKTAEVVESIRIRGGLVAPILQQGKVNQNRAHADTPAMDCDHSSKVWAQNYLYAVEKMKGQGVPIGSDMNGIVHMPAPRFKTSTYDNRPCGGNKPQIAAQVTENKRVKYEFKAHKGMSVGDVGKFGKMTVGDPTTPGGVGRVFDYNTDGLANIGLLPDFIEDLKVIGVTDQQLEPLFNSAEAFVKMWEKIERGQ